MSGVQRARRWGVAVAALVVTTAVVGVVPGPAPTPVSAEASAYVSLVPGRVMETRAGESTVDGQFNAMGIRQAGSETALRVAGRASVAADAKAVVLNLAVTGSSVAGFVTVWPCGQARPLASSLNYDAGQTISNAVTAQIGTGGDICIFTLSATHVIIDVTGAYPSTAKFSGLVPGRVLETRPGQPTADGQLAGIGLRTAGSITELPVHNRAGAGNADAVVLNVAVTESTGPGFVTIFPCGEPRPNASSLNYDAGQTISNAVTAKVGAGGAVCVFTFAATHVIIDLTGAFPANSGYTPLVPARVLETRAGLSTTDGQANGIGIRPASSETPLLVAGRGGVGAVDAVVLNLAVTGSSAPGFVTIFPCGSPRPLASSVNFGPGQTISNAVTAKVGSGGTICIFVFAATHVILDVTGYFPGSASGDPAATSTTAGATTTTAPPQAKPRFQAVYLTAGNSRPIYSPDRFRTDLGRVLDWYGKEMAPIGGKRPDFVRDASGAISVVSIALPQPMAQLQLDGAGAPTALEIKARPEVGGNYPVIFYEGRVGPGCGNTSSMGFIIIPALNCGTNPDQSDQFGFPLGFTLVTAHEIGHALVGFGDCGATFSGGHETALPQDLMYSGRVPTNPLLPIVLDIGNDSYFNLKTGSCADMKNSPLLTP